MLEGAGRGRRQRMPAFPGGGVGTAPGRCQREEQAGEGGQAGSVLCGGWLRFVGRRAWWAPKAGGVGWPGDGAQRRLRADPAP